MIEYYYNHNYLDANEKSHFETLTEDKSLRANLRIMASISGHNEPVDAATAALTRLHRLDWTTIKQETMARQAVRTAPVLLRDSDKVGRHFADDNDHRNNNSKENAEEQVERFVLAIATYNLATGWPTHCHCTPPSWWWHLENC